MHELGIIRATGVAIDISGEPLMSPSTDFILRSGKPFISGLLSAAPCVIFEPEDDLTSATAIRKRGIEQSFSLRPRVFSTAAALSEALLKLANVNSRGGVESSLVLTLVT